MRSGDPMLYHCRSFDVEGRLPGRLALINTDDKPGTAGLAGSFEKKIFSSSFYAPEMACLSITLSLSIFWTIFYLLCFYTGHSCYEMWPIRFPGSEISENCDLMISGLNCHIQIKVKWSRYRLGVAQRVGRGIALLFHDRGTRRGWVVSSTPRPHFTPRRDPVPILQEAGWTPGPIWTGAKSRPHRDSIPDHPARSSVAIPTELPGPHI